MENKVENFLYEDLTYKIRGCAFRVYNNLGFGHKEKIYQEALVCEFQREKIDFEKEKSLSVIYNDKKIGVYRPDFVINNKIIIEIKAVPFMPAIHEKQLTHYLKSTNYKLGLLINFGDKHLVIKRRIWTKSYQQ